MAKIAPIVVWRTTKVSAMVVGVASRADELARDVHGGASFGLMTIRAKQREVFPLKREGALLMRHPVEERRLEAVLVVTGRAVRSRFARGELPFVLIFVAIGAALMRHRPPEVAAGMAAPARNIGMLSDQRKLSGVVIKTAARVIIFPA